MLSSLTHNCCIGKLSKYFAGNNYEDNMNRCHLDYFYWLLAILSLLNFLVYLWITRRLQVVLVDTLSSVVGLLVILSPLYACGPCGHSVSTPRFHFVFLWIALKFL